MDTRTALASTAPVAASHRVWGLDLARFLALIGMMFAHLGKYDVDAHASALYPFVSGKAAALFAVLAGVGIALTTHADLAAGRVRAARATVLGRGFALVILGLTLGLLPAGPFIILVYYGVMFWALLPLLRVSSRTLLTIAAVLATAWPPVSMMLRADLPPFELGSPSWMSVADPAMFLRGLFLTGIYPVPTWIVYALVGLAVGRAVRSAADTAAVRRLGVRLATGGLTLALGAWTVTVLIAGPAIAGLAERMGVDPASVTAAYFGDSFGTALALDPAWLLSASPHSGTTLDLLLTIGSALTALGLCLVVGTVVRAGVRRVLEPVRCTGAAPLTIYALHIVAVSAATMIAAGRGDGPLQWYTVGYAIWGIHVAGALLVGTILMLVHRRGPLESVVTWAGRRASGRGRAPVAA